MEKAPYNKMSINPNYKVKPGLQRELWVFVTQDLKAMRVITEMGLLLLPRLRVEAGNEPVKSTEHDMYFNSKTQTIENKALNYYNSIALTVHIINMSKNMYCRIAWGVATLEVDLRAVVRGWMQTVQTL